MSESAKSEFAIWLEAHAPTYKAKKKLAKTLRCALDRLLGFAAGDPAWTIGAGRLYRLAQHTGLSMDTLYSQWRFAQVIGKVTPIEPGAKRHAIYVATWFNLRHKAKQAAKELEAEGHTITHKWWEVEEPDHLHLESDAKAWTDFHRECAVNDVKGVREASAVVLLVPRSGGCGMWVEMGIALANNIPVYLVPSDEVGVKPYPGRANWRRLVPTPRRSIFETLGRPMHWAEAKWQLRNPGNPKGLPQFKEAANDVAGDSGSVPVVGGEELPQEPVAVAGGEGKLPGDGGS